MPDRNDRRSTYGATYNILCVILQSTELNVVDNATDATLPDNGTETTESLFGGKLPISVAQTPTIALIPVIAQTPTIALIPVIALVLIVALVPKMVHIQEEWLDFSKPPIQKFLILAR